MAERLTDINTTDVQDAIRLGCHTMCSVFNSDDDQGVPFFNAHVRPDARLGFSWAHSESHVPGRHLHALLRAEDAAGTPLNELCIDRHAQAAFFSYSGPVPLPLNRQAIGGPLVHFLPHNIREGFHALSALAQYRHSDRASRLMEASIDAIRRLWNPTTGWDQARIEEMGLRMHDSPYIAGLARAIGPLVKYYRSTGYGPALELAITLKDKAIRECFSQTGAYDRESFGSHAHSVTCTMSSLAQLADLTHDSPLLRRVKAFFDNGLWELRDALGWSIENAASESDPDLGEMNNTGDILETALILGRWGYAEYYGDAERILRGHLLPAQLRDVSFIENRWDPHGEDGQRDVAQRLRGAFGFPAPYGHEPIGTTRVRFNLDIVGGTVASLCEAYGEMTRLDEAGHWVNLLFDRETDNIRVESPYTYPTLRVTLKRPGALFVRLPRWTKREELVIEGSGAAPINAGDYLFFAQPPAFKPISIGFPLTEQELALEHRTRQIRVRLRGDAVTEMDNFGADLTFFDPLD